MKHPKQADRVCEWAYAIAMTVYLIVAICGYLMYGTDVSDEVSLFSINHGANAETDVGQQRSS